ncbi:MAG: SCP2 sterol-binding domain-containing protein [Pseudomonadota bacterium]
MTTQNLRQPTLHTAGLAAAEAVANNALRLSPHSRRSLAGLAHQTLAIECLRPQLTLYLCSDEAGELQLRGVHEDDVSTRVTGTIEDFLELARARDPSAELINGAIQVLGDTSLLLSMQKILADLEIDWEAPLVDGLGDVVGHQLAEILRGLFSWSSQAGASLRRQISEFAREELRLAPPKLALDELFEDIANLSDASERLTQRTTFLRQRAERLLANG